MHILVYGCDASGAIEKSGVNTSVKLCYFTLLEKSTRYGFLNILY